MARRLDARQWQDEVNTNEPTWKRVVFVFVVVGCRINIWRGNDRLMVQPTTRTRQRGFSVVYVTLSFADQPTESGRYHDRSASSSSSFSTEVSDHRQMRLDRLPNRTPRILADLARTPLLHRRQQLTPYSWLSQSAVETHFLTCQY